MLFLWKYQYIIYNNESKQFYIYQAIRVGIM